MQATQLLLASISSALDLGQHFSNIFSSLCSAKYDNSTPSILLQVCTLPVVSKRWLSLEKRRHWAQEKFGNGTPTN